MLEIEQIVVVETDSTRWVEIQTEQWPLHTRLFEAMQMIMGGDLLLNPKDISFRRLMSTKAIRPEENGKQD